MSTHTEKKNKWVKAYRTRFARPTPFELVCIKITNEMTYYTSQSELVSRTRSIPFKWKPFGEAKSWASEIYNRCPAIYLSVVRLFLVCYYGVWKVAFRTTLIRRIQIICQQNLKSKSSYSTPTSYVRLCLMQLLCLECPIRYNSNSYLLTNLHPKYALGSL